MNKKIEEIFIKHEDLNDRESNKYQILEFILNINDKEKFKKYIEYISEDIVDLDVLENILEEYLSESGITFPNDPDLFWYMTDEIIDKSFEFIISGELIKYLDFFNKILGDRELYIAPNRVFKKNLNDIIKIYENGVELDFIKEYSLDNVNYRKNVYSLKDELDLEVFKGFLLTEYELFKKYDQIKNSNGRSIDPVFENSSLDIPDVFINDNLGNKRLFLNTPGNLEYYQNDRVLSYVLGSEYKKLTHSEIINFFETIKIKTVSKNIFKISEMREIYNRGQSNFEPYKNILLMKDEINNIIETFYKNDSYDFKGNFPKKHKEFMIIKKIYNQLLLNDDIFLDKDNTVELELNENINTFFNNLNDYFDELKGDWWWKKN